MGHVIGKYEHHDGCDCTIMIYIPDHDKIELSKALPFMTDGWIADGEYCDKTIIDMRDALLLLLEKKEAV